MNNQNFIKKIRENDFISFSEVNRNEYPCLQNLSSAFFYKYLPIPDHTVNPEFVYIKQPGKSKKSFNELAAAQGLWNNAWEAGHLRFEMLEDKLPNSFNWLSKYSDKNIYLIPYKKNNNYFAYQHILNLIPAKTRYKNGLPLFKKGIWPSQLDLWYLDQILPKGFDDKLSQAFAFHIWPLLINSSKINSYNKSDPIVVLAHNLNYWVPFLNLIIEDELRKFPRIEPENVEEKNELIKYNKNFARDIKLMKPRKGGFLWYGEDEAWNFSKRLVDTADSNGKLREIIDIVKSNRVKDDFSDIWSFEKEDFERKIYKKRNKYKVSFIELNETIPIQGPNSEIIDNLVWEDFMTLLDPKEKNIIVCIKNGITKSTEISELLGYANHSPVSKALKKIRLKVEKYIE